MGAPEARMDLVEKLFAQALKMKISQLARKYDPNLVFELWTQIVKIDGIKSCSRKWIWKSDLTVMEAVDCLDDYCSGLDASLRKRQAEESKFGGTVA